MPKKERKDMTYRWNDDLQRVEFFDTDTDTWRASFAQTLASVGPFNDRITYEETWCEPLSSYRHLTPGGNVSLSNREYRDPLDLIYRWNEDLKRVDLWMPGSEQWTRSAKGADLKSAQQDADLILSYDETWCEPMEEYVR